MKPEWLPRDIVAPANEAEREAVRIAQRATRIDVTGEMDAATKTALRGVQYVFGLTVTGILDEATAEKIERLRPYGQSEDINE